MKFSVKKTKKSFDFEFEITFKELSLIVGSVETINLILSYQTVFKDILLYRLYSTVNQKKSLLTYYT